MANTRAKVELMGSETHTGRGRTIERGKPVILTNPSDIRYYQSQGGFTVTVLEDAAAKPAGKPAKGKPAKPAPPPVEDDSDDDSDSDDDAEDDSDDDADDTEADDDSEDDGEDDSADGEASPIFKKAQLEALTKSALVELAKDNFGLELNVNDGKGKLVAAILKEQIARANG